ncbi:MAG: permease prefix domain 1-containing protein [Longimicrobiales bacterium]
MILAMWRQLTRGIARLLGRRRTDTDIDDEVAHYFAETESAHLASGMSPEAARRAVVLELGGSLQVRETVRSYGWENGIEDFVTDCRLALRRLRSAPGFAAAVIVTLGVGVGAATAIFSAVRPVLLEPLPYPCTNRRRSTRESRECDPHQMPARSACTTHSRSGRASSRRLR